uniref:FAM3 metabolism regulating signaling molecule D n=1 Tax=Amphilophus citrinellus TaxID=61819 RepID=A0A3Q0SCQ6_AMPCI
AGLRLHPGIIASVILVSVAAVAALKYGGIAIFRQQLYLSENLFCTFLAPTASAPKCSLSRVCPPSHIALRIRSGAANIVGPTICFDGKMYVLMCHVLNNVGPGLNIVVINGTPDTGPGSCIWTFKDILAPLKKIKPGMIVLVASFDDVTEIMTNEMRELFTGMGSTLIRSVKRRDSWVFAGRAGTKIKSLFEKQAVNDEKNDIYEGWPEMVEVGGCFPRAFTD